MFRVVLLVALFVHLASAGAPPTCATPEKIQNMSSIVQVLLTKLVTSGLVTMDMTTMNATIPDQNIPALLDLLCNTTETKTTMQQLESEVQACPDLLLSSPSLQPLKIKGVGFAEMFASFGDVNNFCECRAPLPHAWALLDSAPMLMYQDASSAYTSIAAVNNLCGATLKPVIMSIAGRPDSDSCKIPLTSQAGYGTSEDRMKLDKMKILVESHCTNFAAADWTCVTQKAKLADFKECITTKGNEVGNKASCGKRDCVMDKFNCSENAKEMYIDAVNLEMNMEIKDMAMSQDCNSAAGFQISVLTIFASFMLFFC